MGRIGYERDDENTFSDYLDLRYQCIPNNSLTIQKTINVSLEVLL